MQSSIRKLRLIVQTFAPEIFHWCRSYRLRMRFHAQFGADQRVFRETFYPPNTKPSVLTGPFRGMLYLDETVWGPITPKWAGSYEQELEDIIEKMIPSGYDRIVNLGCAEGYYAVGLALLIARCEVFAFDVDPFARKQVCRLAELNQVFKRFHVFGRCSHSRLNELIDGKTLILADIEGDEMGLLDPSRAPNLKEADLLIEIHEDPGFSGMTKIEEQLTRCFSESHVIERRVSYDRGSWIDQHQALWQGKISRDRMARALDEARSHSQVWLWARAKPVELPAGKISS
jgi:hypothetical protein